MKIYVNLSQATHSVPNAETYVKSGLKSLNLPDSQAKGPQRPDRAVPRVQTEGFLFESGPCLW
jgi:hypothetical protein